MKDKFTIELTMKAGLSVALYQDCGSLDAFKRWLGVTMFLAMSRQLLVTDKIYLELIQAEVCFCLS